MSDVNTVFITKEVADMLGLSAAYIVRLAKKIGLNKNEMREAGTRNYLFSDVGVEKLRQSRLIQK